MSLRGYDEWKADVGDWPSGSSGDTASLFWRAFDFELRHGGMAAAARWLDTQRGYRFCAALVAEADQRLAGLTKGAA